MIIKDLFPIFDTLAPLAYAEDFDNVGLLVGNPHQKVTGILVCHDALETVIDEAVKNHCNIVVCFHPILFQGLKKITGKTYVERAIMKAIKQDVAIYALHTAFDNHPKGVNYILSEALGIENAKILVPKEYYIQKLVTYTRPENAEDLRQAMFQAGAGRIGNYENCSFNLNGIGTYQGNEASNPNYGQKHEYVSGEEVKIEVTFEKHLQTQIIQAMKAAHVYEEVAHEIYTLENKHQNIGLGMIGEINQPLTETDFLNHVKNKLDLKIIRHSAFLSKPIKKVAILGGSGSFAISAAISQGADAFITADLKYHQFYEGENKLLILDVGHFESEKFIKNHIFDFLKKKITNFAVILSKTDTNPVKYF